MFSILRKIIILTATVTSLAVSFNALAKENTKDSIVVGVITQNDSSNSVVDSVGPFYGINLDYLSNIAKVLGLNLELRAYQHIPPLLNDVENGVIDGAVGFSKTPEREKRFLFSKPFFSSTIAAWYRDASYKDRDIRDIKWVCVEGSVYCDNLTSQGIDNIIYVKTRLEAFDDVRRGKANALIYTYVGITEYLDANDIVKGIVDIPNWLQEEEVSFIASLDNQKLIDNIDKILEWEQSGKNIRSVASKNPYHINDKLLVAYRRNHKSNLTITYSSSDEAYPFLYRDSHTGKLDGFFPDFIDLIQSRTGLAFSYVKPTSSLSNGLTAFDADIVPVSYVGPVPKSDWLITKPFMHSNYVSIQAEESERDKSSPEKAGILLSLKKQGLVHLGVWQQDRFDRYDDLKQLLTDLKSGVLDVAYIPDDVVHSMIAQDQVDGLVINEQDVLTFSNAFAVAKHNTQLQHMLNSIIETIDSNEIEKLLRSHRSFNLVYGYDDEQMAKFFLAGAVAFSLMFAAAYFILAHLRLKVKLAELNANNEEAEKQWLMGIIQEINSLVFIHGEDNQLEMSNCANYKSKQCQECKLKSCSTNAPLVNNSDELATVIGGQRISEEVASAGCELGIKHVYRERKTIASPSGKKKFVLTVIQDITQQKEREQALIDAQKEAQTAVRARENFLATMSHELRTPLSAAHGILDLLNRQVTADSNRELIAQAMRSLNHLNVLVDEVLDYSKLEAGQLTVAPAKTDLLKTLCDVFRSFEPRALAKGLDYKVTIKPFSDAFIEIDALRLVQITTNLLSNAVKFTAEGEIGISVILHEKQLILKVADTGIGMTDGQLEGILNPFVQADDSITRKYGGTGLGLSIVDRLIDCMGGVLCIDSQFGLGTTITVKLPIERCDSEPEVRLNWTYSEALPLSIRQWCDAWKMQPATLARSMANLYAAQDNEAGFDGVMLRDDREILGSLTLRELQYPDALFNLLSQTQQETKLDELKSEEVSWILGTVLVAEDNPINQSVISMQLRELGIEPVIVNNGREAWEYINQDENVVLLLTDFHMPEMDGYELIKHVRASGFKLLPIIGVTAEDARLANERTQDIGIDDVLYKPYDLNKLKTVLVPFIGKKEKTRLPDWIKRFKTQDAKEIARVFSQSMATDIENLQAASTERDKKRVIHGIKGAVGAIGISMLTELCIEAERVTAAEFDRRAAELILRIEQEIDNIDYWAEMNEYTA
ncbi:transporter substrate-binding domain-containing protein [Vibrio parahaemolyticus]|uniref:ATP-binding protein n=1 Tax=Vibrio parahaemolyticus TaxID=670 RepID=UPI000A38B180|nr:transporter substrate-binding domain-containing protein [Vibrio parahaemolyticus]MDF5658552.1 transporter substrate-binding domain-containing protein [Vibrio parahaemolyticus]MEA5352951.1 transporter substrate-binding domain-containing protein [Vibrio parahaemolyticus]OUJ33382.1 histidine kinase [Vibrio parahaemolyticus]TOD65758.1 histidine kinase [Vibrio parahaemolyticus]TPB07477.1 response regulator [Vibrio parahaemolyticus]